MKKFAALVLCLVWQRYYGFSLVPQSSHHVQPSQSLTPARQSKLFSASVAKDSTTPSLVDGNDEADSTSKIRPLHQNWWPVATTDSLQSDRPNPLQVLGKPLVTYFDSSTQEWKIMDDYCSHRFAPLSEGRLLDNSIQCAYHGWTFDGQGTCTNVPQQPDRVDKAKSVQAYSVREDLGMLWVWMDPSSAESLGESIQLPIDQFLRKCYDKMGSGMCFMRDLPYGMEILGENLLDLSHLPFAHHSVGNLDRNTAKDLPTRMLSSDERKKNLGWDSAFGDALSTVLPAAQAEITQAAEHDPIFASMYRSSRPEMMNFKDWTTHIGYFDPMHVRYQRKSIAYSAVELFMCPTSEGRSRVFLFNCFEGMVTEPKGFKDKMKQKVLKKVMNSSRGHMIAHQIFDGDGIFLHKQGNRMKMADLTFRDYSTPASSDVLLNSYRRFLDAAATQTRKAGLESVADSVVGTNSYGDDAMRSHLLDRYNTHTVHCPICMTALKQARKKQVMLKSLQTGFQGATGSGLVALAALGVARKVASMTVPNALLGSMAAVSSLGMAGSFLCSKLQQRNQKTINSFIFEDYVHADKD